MALETNPDGAGQLFVSTNTARGCATYYGGMDGGHLDALVTGSWCRPVRFTPTSYFDLK
jgi:hypothetical protein